MRTDSISALAELIREAPRCVAFTGAGISTLSGIRDFRGKNGLYTTVNADRMFDIDLFFLDPSIYYKLAKDFIYGLDEKEPSIVHHSLATLEKAGYVDAVITQNIDLLHTKAGSKRVLEIHGTPAVHRCPDCGHVQTFDEIAPSAREGIIPLCPDCKRALKPDITFFGEALPQKTLEEAIEESRKADLMLVLGSSLLVHPAAGLPERTLRAGGKIVIVNDQNTPLDDRATLRFYDLQETFEKLMGDPGFTL